MIASTSSRCAHRSLVGLLAGLLLAAGTLLGPAEPASAGYEASYASLPVGNWSGSFGVSSYRWKLNSNPWSPFGTVRALGQTCQRWTTLGEVEWIVVGDPAWDWALQVVTSNGPNEPPTVRHFICKGFGPV